MKQFIACICHSDFNQLLVEGEANAEQLAEAWSNLFYEYCDLVEATETIYRTRLIAEINLNKKKNEFVADWVKVLQVQYSQNIADAIRHVGYDFEMDPMDQEQYQADLARINSELILARLQVRIKEAEYASILENQSTQDTVDEKYFSTIFFRINNYAKREAINGQTTVQDYCAALRDFVAYIESNKTHKA